MSHPHNLHELQEGIGQTGKFGEIFIGLGALILLGGIVLATAGHLGWLADPNNYQGGNGDAVQVGWLFAFEGAGFVMFGIMIVATGWARHHNE